MSPQDFDRLVEEAMEIIPPHFRGRLKNLLFVVEAEPREHGLLGLYEGRPETERSLSEPSGGPDRITIYQGPHERAARSRVGLRRLVEETIWHEVAHYFGLNEREVLRAENRRRRRISKIREL